MTFKRRARDRYKRNDKRVNAKHYELLTCCEDRLLAVPETGQNVGRHLAATEDRHGRGEGFEIAIERHLRLTRHDPGPHVRRHRFEMHAERIDAGILHAREPEVLVRRLTLPLDRQINGCLHGSRTLGEDGCAAVAAGWRAGRHDHVLHAIELDGSLRDLSELRGRLALDGTA